MQGAGSACGNHGPICVWGSGCTHGPCVHPGPKIHTARLSFHVSNDEDIDKFQLYSHTMLLHATSLDRWWAWCMWTACAHPGSSPRDTQLCP